MRMPSIRRRVAIFLSVLTLGAFTAAPQAGATAPKAATTRTGSLTTAPSGSVALWNNWTDLCADLPNYGSVGPNTPVTQYYCNTSLTQDNQTWTFIPSGLSDTGKQLYEIVNDKSGLCLDLPNYGYEPAGTPVSVYPCASDPSFDNQLWYLTDVTIAGGGGGTLIQNWVTGNYCLDVSGVAGTGQDTGTGVPLTIYPCWDSTWRNGGYDDHLWQFLPAT